MPRNDAKASAPDISVIIPIYRTHYLQRPLKSLQRQNFSGRLEIILVDDASPEDVPTAVKACWDKNIAPPVYIRHDANKGPGEARNTGLQAATGEYVAFIDHDDEIHPNYFAKLHRTAKEKKADFVSCGVLQRLPDGKQRVYSDKNWDIVGGENVLSLMTQFNLNIATWGSLVRRDLVESNQIRFGKVEFEDILFFFQVVCHCRHYVAVPDLLYLFYTNPDSLSQTPVEHKGYSYFEGLPTILPRIKKLVAEIGKKHAFVLARERQIYLFFLRLSLLTLRQEQAKLAPEEYERRLERSLREHFGDDYIYIRTFLDLNDFLRGEWESLRQNMSKLAKDVAVGVNAMGRELNKPLI